MLQKGEYECNRSVSRLLKLDSATLKPTPPKESLDWILGLARVREAPLVSKSMSIGSPPASVSAKPWALLTPSHAVTLASDCKASLPLRESRDLLKDARSVEFVPPVSELNDVAMESPLKEVFGEVQAVEMLVNEVDIEARFSDERFVLDELGKQVAFSGKGLGTAMILESC